MRRRPGFAGAGRQRGAAVPSAWRPARASGRGRRPRYSGRTPKYCGSSWAAPRLSGMISIGPIAPTIALSRWTVSTGPVPPSRMRASRKAKPSAASFSAKTLNVPRTAAREPRPAGQPGRSFRPGVRMSRAEGAHLGSGACSYGIGITARRQEPGEPPFRGVVLLAEPPAERGSLVQRALRLLAVDVDPDAGNAAGAQRGDHDQAGFLDDGLGEHLLVLAVSPAAVLVVRQEPAGSRDLDDVVEKAGGDRLGMDGAEGGHVRGGDQWLQPVPRDSHGRHDTRAAHGKRFPRETRGNPLRDGRAERPGPSGRGG